MMTNHLVRGDPMAPAPTDLIAQTRMIDVGKTVPLGWRVLSGNQFHSEIGRLAYRFEIEEESI